MKKAVSLILTVVLLTSILVIPGGVTASAKEYSTEVPIIALNLTFEGDAPYGIAASRGNFEDYRDGQLIIDQGSTGSLVAQANGAVFFLGADGTVGKSPENMYSNDNSKVISDPAILFEFKASTRYRVTFKYKILAGSYGNQCNNAVFYAMDNPTYAANNGDNTNYLLSQRCLDVVSSVPQFSWEPDQETNLSIEDTDWQTGYYEFTTQDTEDGFYGAMHPGNNDGYKAAAYEYIRIEILEQNGNPFTPETETKSYYYTESPLHEMNNAETTDAVSFQTDATNIVYDNDEKYGKVIKFTCKTYGRVAFNDQMYLTKGKKYYISFDGKVDEDTNPQVVSVIGKGDCSGIRYFMTSADNKDEATKFYINGSNVKATEFKYSTEWQRFGIILDTSHENVDKGTNGTSVPLFTESNKINFMLGAASATVYLDNVKIVECTDMPEAIDNIRSLELVQRSIRKAETKVEGEYVSAGLRVKGSIDRSVRDSADEIGFIVLPSLLAVQDEEWFDMKKPEAERKFKTAVCYQKDKYGKVIKDVVYFDDFFGDYVEYQMILTGLSKEGGGTSYNIRYAFVMYVKTGNKYTYYGLSETSYNEVQALYDVYDMDSPNKVS